MKIIKNHVIEGSAEKPIVLDLFWKESFEKKPVVIFCHGYKGFKDWGAWELVAKSFAEAGFLFIKFNFSHNGGTVENPIDFPDLEAFGKNTYTIEKNDLENVIDWVHLSPLLKENVFDKKNLTIIGHSRGGGVALLQAGKDSRITKIITWAAISDIGSRFPKEKELDIWKTNGVRFVKNGRTKQDMPHEYGFYEDYLQNEGELNILEATKNIAANSLLIIHGENDEAVSLHEAQTLHQINPSSQLEIILNTGHTFGSKHPWELDVLPKALKTVVELSIGFVGR